MKLKLDENLPPAARSAAEALGHDVDTVADEGMLGSADPDVFAAAQREGRFLITLDVGFGDIRQYPPGTHAGIAVVRLGVASRPAIADAVGRLLNGPGRGDLTGALVVVRQHLIRVRRSD